MIQNDCFTSAWIDSVSKRLKYNDKNLIEKVIRALSLLEMLVEAKCPMVFKGGTSLMLILNDTANRLSIDIDVICPPGTDIEQYLTAYKQHGFTEKELVERKSRGNDVPKSHSKFFYQIAYTDGNNTPSYILLDVLLLDMSMSVMLMMIIQKEKNIQIVSQWNLLTTNILLFQEKKKMEPVASL